MHDRLIFLEKCETLFINYVDCNCYAILYSEIYLLKIFVNLRSYFTILHPLIIIFNARNMILRVTNIFHNYFHCIFN
jgi:hypothetical protein